MNLKYSYWYFKEALSSKICDDIINYGKSFQDHLAHIGDQRGDKTNLDVKDLKKKRNSNIVWLDEPWIYNHIHPFIYEANKNAGWNFQWDWSESCKFTKYNKGQFYDWHCDSWETPYNSPKELYKHNKIRKLSASISLSDPKEYEGGDLKFRLLRGSKINTIVCEEIKPKGSIVIFPSFLDHKVERVKKGTRYSLVIWSLGHPFT